MLATTPSSDSDSDSSTDGRSNYQCKRDPQSSQRFLRGTLYEARFSSSLLNFIASLRKQSVKENFRRAIRNDL